MVLGVLFLVLDVGLLLVVEFKVFGFGLCGCPVLDAICDLIWLCWKTSL